MSLALPDNLPRARAKTLSGPPAFQEHLAAVCTKHKIVAAQIVEGDRRVKVARARQDLMFRLAWCTDWSLARIGQLLNRDHSTVVHGIRMHAERNNLPVPKASFFGGRKVKR